MADLPELVELAAGCFVARCPEWQLNAGVVVGSAGVLVVDTRAGLRLGRLLRTAARVVFGETPIRWAVNTHEHFDHVLGNAAFDDAVIYAHERAADAMADSIATEQGLIRDEPGRWDGEPGVTAEVLRDLLETEPALPGRTFSAAAVIDLGDRYVELLHLGRGHTAGDAVVRVPDADLVFAGDLVEEAAGGVPGFGSDSWPLEWAPTLDLLIGILGPSSLVVPGHGAVVGRAFVEAQRDAIGDVAEMIRTLAAAGVPVDEALAAGSSTPRPRPLAATVPGSVESREVRSGWPFPAAALSDAVRRGYSQLSRE